MNKAVVNTLRRTLWLLPIPLIWILLSHTGSLSFFENKAMDWRFQLRGEIDAPVKLIYVDLDAESFREYLGERPWPRGEFGKISEILLVLGKVKAIGFDLVLSKFNASFLVPQEIVDQDVDDFARVTNRNPNIILATAYSQGDDMPLIYKGETDLENFDFPETPHPRFIQRHGINQMGLIGYDQEISDGITPRWVPMFSEASKYGLNFTYYQIALQLARVSYGLPPEAIKRSEDKIELVDSNGLALLSIPLWGQQMLEINWFSKFNSPKNPRYSMYQVATAYAFYTEGNEEQQAQADEFFREFNDAIVFIGPTDPLLQDLAPSPMDDYPVPKVGVHANVLKTIFSGIYIGRIPDWSKYLITLALTIVVALMATSTGQHSRLLKMSSGLILFGYIFISFWYFSNLHIVLPLIAPVGAALSTSLIGTFVQLIIEEKQKGRIKDLFGTYVSPEVVHQMIESEEEPQLGGREETITAFFSDIQSFSSFSEYLTPERLVDLMNEYLTAMTDIVQEEGGSLDKYIGDAMCAMFGAPLPMEDHANRACIATQRMQLRQAELREKWKSEGDKWPEIVFTMQSRIGLNTGLMLIGNMGSETRFNFTMMGDAVNLAARCESGAKSYGVFTMITEDTMKMAEEQGDGCVYRFLDRIIVKGRKQPVGVYEVVGFKKDLTQKTYDCLDIFDTAINKYLDQDFDKAIELFGKSSEIEPNRPNITPGVSTNPSLIMKTRCLLLKLSPPGDNWDGVYTMTSK